MSIIRAIKHRLGLSVTPANNFLLDASANNGTMKLARESGQDIMTVDAAGKVAFPVGMPLSSGSPIVESGSNANGSYVKFADGTMVQWGVTGTVTTSTALVITGMFASPPTLKTLPVPFIDTNYSVSGSGRNWTTWSGWAMPNSNSNVASFNWGAWSGANNATCSLQWMAIGRWKA